MIKSDVCEYCDQSGTEDNPLIRFNRVCGKESPVSITGGQHKLHEECKDLFCKKNNIYLTGFFNLEVAEGLNRCGIL